MLGVCVVWYCWFLFVLLNGLVILLLVLVNLVSVRLAFDCLLCCFANVLRISMVMLLVLFGVYCYCSLSVRLVGFWWCVCVLIVTFRLVRLLYLLFGCVILVYDRLCSYMVDGAVIGGLLFVECLFAWLLGLLWVWFVVGCVGV